MSSNSNYQKNFRIIHRYLGFFLAGIMTVYALSGIVLVYRETDLFKIEKNVEKVIKPGLSEENIAREIRVRELTDSKIDGNTVYFKNGQYNSETGEIKYIAKQLPYILDRFTRLHKTSTKNPLYWLNLFFAASLLFFVISAFFMFKPKTEHFKKGLYFTGAGLVFTVILLFIY